MAKIIVQNTEITVLSQNDKDYISLTDMANGNKAKAVLPTSSRIGFVQDTLLSFLVLGR